MQSHTEVTWTKAISVSLVMCEMQLCIDADWDIPAPLRVIFENLQRGDGLTTYKELWHAKYPHLPWKGCHSKNVVMAMMEDMNNASVAKGQPMWTAFIVRQDTRRMSPKAKTNLHEKCRELGRDVKIDVEQFINSERARARHFIRNRQQANNLSLSRIALVLINRKVVMRGNLAETAEVEAFVLYSIESASSFED